MDGRPLGQTLTNTLGLDRSWLPSGAGSWSLTVPVGRSQPPMAAPQASQHLTVWKGLSQAGRALPSSRTSEPRAARHVGQFRRGWPWAPRVPIPSAPETPVPVGWVLTAAPVLNEVGSEMRCCPFFGFHGDRPLAERGFTRDLWRLHRAVRTVRTVWRRAAPPPPGLPKNCPPPLPARRPCPLPRGLPSGSQRTACVHTGDRDSSTCQSIVLDKVISVPRGTSVPAARVRPRSHRPSCSQRGAG